MRSKGFTHLCLVGHTDNVGSLTYNKALSRKRVQSVRTNVATRFHPSSTKVTYRGETAPLSGNGTPDGRKANRRVTISFG
jgi:outer membrane protein OmpA-like peptidoglycan-associated protein